MDKARTVSWHASPIVVSIRFEVAPRRTVISASKFCYRVTQTHEAINECQRPS